jgi:hypothetical protein
MVGREGTAAEHLALVLKTTKASNRLSRSEIGRPPLSDDLDFGILPYPRSVFLKNRKFANAEVWETAATADFSFWTGISLPASCRNDYLAPVVAYRDWVPAPLASAKRGHGYGDAFGRLRSGQRRYRFLAINPLRATKRPGSAFWEADHTQMRPPDVTHVG